MFRWEIEFQEVFEKIKQALANPPMLMLPEPEKSLNL